MYVSNDEIAVIKKRVQAGLEPWQSAYVRMISDAERAMEQMPVTVTRKGADRHDYWTEPCLKSTLLGL